MKTKIDKINGKLGIGVLMFLVSLMCMFPYYGEKIPWADDLVIHMERIESIANAFKNGQGYPLYVYQDLIDGYGYAFGLFYPDIFLVPAAVIRLLGASPVLTVKLYIFIIIICTCVTSYISGKRIFDNDIKAAIVIMILYTMGLYHLVDVFRRFAVGEATAMIFIPLLFWALKDFAEGHKRKGLMCITFSGLLLSHTITFALSVIAAAMWMIIKCKKIIKRPMLIAELLLEAVCCILVTAFYWVPCIEQFMSDKFYVNGKQLYHTQTQAISFADIYVGDYTVNFFEIVVLLFMFGLCFKYKKINKNGLRAGCLAIGILLLETNLFTWFWKLIDMTPLTNIQFPWRLNVFVEFLLAYAFAAQLKQLKDVKIAVHIDKIVAINAKSLVVITCLIFGMYNIYMLDTTFLWMVNYSADDLSQKTLLIGGEWLPEEANTVIDGGARIPVTYDTELDGTYNSDGSYEFYTDGNVGECTIPKYYYKGYAVTYTDADGAEHDLPVMKDESNGLVKTELSGEEGLVRVYYRGTAAQRVSLWLSIASVVGLAGAAVYGMVGRRKKNKRQTAQPV